MDEVRYSRACSEVLDIIKHMSYEEASMVSIKFMKFLYNKCDKNYKPELDYTKNISQMDLSEETMALLSIAYRNFWCPEDKKHDFDDKIKNEEKGAEEEAREKYGNSVFEPVNKERVSDNKMVIVENNVFKKIMKKIKSIFIK